MKFVLLDNNNLVTQTRTVAQPGYIEAPDNVEVRWEKSGLNWQKSAVLLAMEAAEAAITTKKSNVSSNIATLRTWGQDAQATATPAAWSALNATQKDTAMRLSILRTGIFMERFADFFEGHRFNQLT